jgi:hypothetical protein
VGSTLAILDKAQAILDVRRDNEHDDNKATFSEISTMIDDALQRHRVVGRYTKDSRISHPSNQ